jgi:hypothetical protein
VKRAWWAVLVFGLGVAVISGCATTNEDGGQPVDQQRPAAPSEPAAGEPPVNTLKWTTASEVDNFGFDIYRSVAEDGPFEKITDEPIAGAGTTDEPQSYVFVDSEIDPTRDYYYYIESISLGGVREKFSPVIRSPAKRPAAD